MNATTPTSTIYTVTICTECRACAMALAGQAPRLGTIRKVWVTEPQPNGVPLTIHANSATVYCHDGSPFACPEHGGKLFVADAGLAVLAQYPDVPVELCSGPPGYLPARARERALHRGEVT